MGIDHVVATCKTCKADIIKPIPCFAYQGQYHGYHLNEAVRQHKANNADHDVFVGTINRKY